MDIVNQAKNIGAVLGTASVIAYISGYLALRARAFALGIDPAFKLADEAYVFAGFRFLFITLIVLLLMAPVILLVRWGAVWLARTLQLVSQQPSQWLLLVAVAIVTIKMLMVILSVSGVLLQEGPLRGSGLAELILGGAANLRLLLNVAIVLLAALSALWLQDRLVGARGPFEGLLALVVTLQIVMLPIYHGVLAADRRVRVLAMTPDKVQGLTGPLGIVDRTAEHVTLLGVAADGGRRLASVKLDDLDGIPIRQVVPLEHFVRDVLNAGPKPTGPHDPVSNGGPKASDSGGPSQGGQDMASESTEVEKGFFASLLESLQITLDAIGALGEGDVDSGELWEVDLDASGRPSKSRQIGEIDDLAWPVAGPDGSTYYALRQGKVVRLDAEGGSPQVLDEGTTWSKLLGVREDGTVLGLVRQEGQTRPAMLPPGGHLQIGSRPLSEEDKAAVARLLQEVRSHTGGQTLSVDTSERGGRGIDVFLEAGGESFNLSDCGHDSCGQASLSPDLRRALFIRHRRY